jgi:hypothetical protein
LLRGYFQSFTEKKGKWKEKISLETGYFIILGIYDIHTKGIREAKVSLDVSTGCLRKSFSSMLKNLFRNTHSSNYMLVC